MLTKPCPGCVAVNACPLRVCMISEGVGVLGVGVGVGEGGVRG